MFRVDVWMQAHTKKELSTHERSCYKDYCKNIYSFNFYACFCHLFLDDYNKLKEYHKDLS